MQERFTEIKRRSIEGEIVDCTIDYKNEILVKFANDQFILTVRNWNTRRQDDIKSKHWSVIVSTLDLLLKRSF